MGKNTSTAVTRSHDWTKKFISELSKRGIVRDAAAAAKINRSTAYARRKDDAEFADQWASAIEDAADRMESEAVRRAVVGVRKPVYYKGTRVGYVQEYSDGLLMFLLKGIRPHKFKDRTDITSGDEPIVISVGVIGAE